MRKTKTVHHCYLLNMQTLTLTLTCYPKFDYNILTHSLATKQLLLPPNSPQKQIFHPVFCFDREQKMLLRSGLL
ncbi:hypothetical protein Hanom_Chr02g00175561 [Helianthus anomalus]